MKYLSQKWFRHHYRDRRKSRGADKRRRKAAKQKAFGRILSRYYKESLSAMLNRPSLTQLLNMTEKMQP